MDYDKETHCVFKEGFVTHVVKSDCKYLSITIYNNNNNEY
jgi:hypothetical protein